jgi:hypothetical protein
MLAYWAGVVIEIGAGDGSIGSMSDLGLLKVGDGDRITLVAKIQRPPRCALD